MLLLSIRLRIRSPGTTEEAPTHARYGAVRYTYLGQKICAGWYLHVLFGYEFRLPGGGTGGTPPAIARLMLILSP